MSSSVSALPSNVDELRQLTNGNLDAGTVRVLKTIASVNAQLWKKVCRLEERVQRGVLDVTVSSDIRQQLIQAFTAKPENRRTRGNIGAKKIGEIDRRKAQRRAGRKQR